MKRHAGSHSYFLVLILLLSSLNQISYADDVVNSADQSTATQTTKVGNTVEGTAADWNLTPEEWQKYQQLMQGVNGHWYPQLTPSEILGLNADNAQDQQHFAEIVAREEHDRLAKELQFNNAVHQAMLMLYADEPVIKPFDITPFNPVNNVNLHKTNTK